MQSHDGKSGAASDGAPFVSSHRLLFVQDGRVVGEIRDVDGIEASAQADGDPRELNP